MRSVPFTFSDQNFVGISHLVRATCISNLMLVPHSSFGRGTSVKLDSKFLEPSVLHVEN